MDRRSLIKHLGFAGSASLFSSSMILACRSDSYKFQFLTESQFEILDELSEIILPETEQSPGARTAKVAHFLDSYAYHCFDDIRKQKFIYQLTNIDNTSLRLFNSNFTSITDKDRIKCVKELEKETAYLTFKSSILFAYFTSKTGVTKALRYLPIPTKYEGDMSYKNGDRAWAS